MALKSEALFCNLLGTKPKELAENFNKQGGYIPGVRPGTETKKYITTVLLRITTFGTLFLVVIAALPILFQNYSNVGNTNISLGGTGLIIVVGVALETYKQLEGSILSRSYKRGYRR